ncbi:hypothetical protein MIND_00160400 [Mycena indigotica]|uniref:Uncharacterized protein n=1 Tax=Mycena indigotica TaxID=2126181 RepID=A0A8H6TFI6_9AGAR|nr:uncharacterized protein MIND_00160400 [Mycena indigotica]KAF7316416.1 hypothetical protein MIND_00160400 [Mycena indigotica]
MRVVNASLSDLAHSVVDRLPSSGLAPLKPLQWLPSSKTGDWLAKEGRRKWNRRLVTKIEEEQARYGPFTKGEQALLMSVAGTDHVLAAVLARLGEDVHPLTNVVALRLWPDHLPWPSPCFLHLLEVLCICLGADNHEVANPDAFAALRRGITRSLGDIMRIATRAIVPEDKMALRHLALAELKARRKTEEEFQREIELEEVRRSCRWQGLGEPSSLRLVPCPLWRQQHDGLFPAEPDDIHRLLDEVELPPPIFPIGGNEDFDFEHSDTDTLFDKVEFATTSTPIRPPLSPVVNRLWARGTPPFGSNEEEDSNVGHTDLVLFDEVEPVTSNTTIPPPLSPPKNRLWTASSSQLADEKENISQGSGDGRKKEEHTTAHSLFFH